MQLHTWRYWAPLLILWTQAGQAEDSQHVLSKDAKLSNDTLLWGPYRPNLYFGVRPRIPKSLTTGLLWAKVDDYQDIQQKFRYTCEQNEGMAGYGWDEYDARTGGHQTIHDAGNKIDITTEFIKIPGGKHGGNWGVRVKGTPREDAPARLMTTVMFTAAMEGFGTLEVQNEPDELGIEGDVILGGNTNELGDFTLRIVDSKENSHPPPSHESYGAKPLARSIVSSLQIPEENLWQVKPIIFQLLKKEIDAAIDKYGQENPPPPWGVFTLPNEIAAGNLHIIQKVFDGPFEFDVYYSSSSAPSQLSSEDFERAAKKAKTSFSERFRTTFHPKAPFDDPKYEQFAKSMFSNLIGGIGYFHGDALVDRSYAPEYDEENEGFWEETAAARARTENVKPEGPAELFSSVPSRPFFPRGFLWDEGFHLIPIADWDMALTLDIVQSWMKLMDGDGWIGREQILGAEARSKVPMEFTVQYPHYANPPTLFLILETLLDELNTHNPMFDGDTYESVRTAHLQDRKLAVDYLRTLYPLLKRHYSWYRKTQHGDVKSYDREAFSLKEAYRWRGRTERHCLTSGIDDYPRPQPPHPGELHTDLISWMGMFSRAMKRIAETIDESDDAREYQSHETAIVRNIDDLHWDKREEVYCDASVDEYEESIHVCHKGYISIFPFMTGLIPPDSPRLQPILDLISDPDELWSDYGIRSLSKQDENYGTDENYWRSPVWINMNYLIVKALYDIAIPPVPVANNPHREQAATIYAHLRHNLVENVFGEWQRTGFAWEQYDPETGRGQRTQHFTGWTSLVVKIMHMPDLPVSAKWKWGKVKHEEL